MKISIVGAGNVGSTLAERILNHGLADVVLLDIREDLAKAKAFDLADTRPLMDYKKSVIGTGDYNEIRNSQIVVITAGFPRKPGMTRDNLIHKNSEIIKEVLKNIKKNSPEAILVIVTNPLDIMTYLAYKESGCDRRKIIGMAGNLDTARFKALLFRQTGVPPDKIETFVLGSHGDTMVPLVSKTLIDGKPLENVLDKENITSLLARTKKRGGEVIALLKSGSAYYSPSAACFEILRAIINDEKKTIPCSCILEGEYGMRDCAIGVPAKLGKSGVEKILEWKLPPDELGALRKSAKLVKDALGKLGERKNARSK
ncbi:MAG: malate dehydrogenase [Candidatus Omnitrophica bacterium]|nr:malate dehydrogenase [Candidatus Omnitrophota bacterium]